MPMTMHLRKFQRGTVAVVARMVHVALIAVAVIVLPWPDVRYPMVYMSGTKPVGEMQRSYVFEEAATTGTLMTRGNLLRKSISILDKIERSVPKSENAKVIYDSAIKDMDNKFAGPLRTREEMNAP